MEVYPATIPGDRSERADFHRPGLVPVVFLGGVFAASIGCSVGVRRSSQVEFS
jgi:hypothetical protein